MTNHITRALLCTAFIAATTACTDNDAAMVSLAEMNDPDTTVTGCADALAEFTSMMCLNEQVATTVCCLTCSNVTIAITDPYADMWTESYIPYGDADSITPNLTGYLLDDPNRQHLHIYTPNASAADIPVLFWAHGNGGLASQSIMDFERSDVAETGYGLVSWESVTRIGSAADTEQCQADFELVMEWVSANGADYGLSTEQWIVGGRSRGTACSWLGANNYFTDREAIEGIYLYNALPISNETQLAQLVALVTTDTAPAYLPYGPCCPKPIVVSGDDKCDIGDDIHNPLNGQRIVDRYAELGMAADITLTDCMEKNGTNVMHYFATLVDYIDEQAGDDDDGSPTQAPTTADEGNSSEAVGKVAVYSLAIALVFAL